MSSFYSLEELKELGFKSVGKDVKVSRKASFYGADKISIGDYSRIDDFCVLSGEIELGKHVHISACCAMFAGDAKITVDDYSGTSSRTLVYATSDDFSGEFMTNPTIPEKYTNVKNEPVYIGKYVQIGAACTVLPGVTIAEGTTVGAMSLIKDNLDEWGIYAGIPAKRIKNRKKDLLELAKNIDE